MDSWIFYSPFPESVKRWLLIALPCEWGGRCNL